MFEESLGSTFLKLGPEGKECLIKALPDSRSSTYKRVSEVFGMGFPGVLELKKAVKTFSFRRLEFGWGLSRCDEKTDPSNKLGEKT